MNVFLFFVLQEKNQIRNVVSELMMTDSELKNHSTLIPDVGDEAVNAEVQATSL